MSMSNFSAKSETKTRSYKPRIKSQAYSILKAMKSLKAEENAVSKKNINEFLFEKGM